MADFLVRVPLAKAVSYHVLCDPPADWKERAYRGLAIESAPLLEGDAAYMRLNDIAYFVEKLPDLTLAQIVAVWRAAHTFYICDHTVPLRLVSAT